LTNSTFFFLIAQSTTAVAALCAEYCKAERVIYATDVEGVYSADPRKGMIAFARHSRCEPLPKTKKKK
jgi:uridylate kinase